MKGKSQISEDDVQRAIRKFLQEGGLIKRLPDEVTPRSVLVGAKWGMYEPVLEFTNAGSETGI